MKEEIQYDDLSEPQKTFTVIAFSLFGGFLCGLALFWAIAPDMEPDPEPFPVPGERPVLKVETIPNESTQRELEDAYRLIQELRATLSAYQNEK